MRKFMQAVTICLLFALTAAAVYHSAVAYVYAAEAAEDEGNASATTSVEMSATVSEPAATTTPALTPEQQSAALGRLFNGRNLNLGDLLVLNQLFPGTGSTAKGSIDNLGNLFILDRLFAGRSSIFSGGQSDLGDLLILNNLFGDGKNILGTGGVLGANADLGNLIILDELFGRRGIF